MTKSQKRSPTSDLREDIDTDIHDYAAKTTKYKLADSNSWLSVDITTNTWLFEPDPTLNLNKASMISMMANHLLSKWDTYKQYITNNDVSVFFKQPKDILLLTYNEKLLYIADIIQKAQWFGTDQQSVNTINAVVFNKMKRTPNIDESELVRLFQEKVKLDNPTINEIQSIIPNPKIIQDPSNSSSKNLYVELTFNIPKEELYKGFFEYIEFNYKKNNYQKKLQEFLALTNTAKLIELLENIKHTNNKITNPYLQFAIKLLAITIIQKLQEEALNDLKLEEDHETKIDILQDTIEGIDKTQKILTTLLPEQTSTVIPGLSLPACDFTHFKNQYGQTIGNILDNLSNITFTIAAETIEEEISSDIINNKIFERIFKISDALGIGQEENQEYINNITKKTNNVDNTERKQDGTLRYPESQCKIANEDWKKNKQQYYQELLKSINLINTKFLSLGINLDINFEHLPKDYNNENEEKIITNFIKESKSKIKNQQSKLSTNLATLSKNIKSYLTKIGKIDITSDYNFAKILRIIITSVESQNISKLTWKISPNNDLKINNKLLKELITNNNLVENILAELNIETENLSFIQKIDKLKEIYSLLYDSELNKPIEILRGSEQKEKAEHLKKSLIDILHEQHEQHEQQKIISSLAKNYDIVQEFKESTLKYWQIEGITGYKKHINKLLSSIRKTKIIIGYHSTQLTLQEQALQTDVTSMTNNEVRKLVFEEEISGNKKYKLLRNKFLILKDDNGMIHIVNHYGGNRLYKPKDPIPKTKNMTTALLALGIGHFGDVKAVFLPSGEQKALKIVREGSTQTLKKAQWLRPKEGWDEEKADLIREQTALIDTNQLIASAKTPTFLRKITKRKKLLLNTIDEQLLSITEPTDVLSTHRTEKLSTKGSLTPREPLSARGSTTPRDPLSARSSTTPRDPLSARIATTPRIVSSTKKNITHMSGTAHYMLMELSGSKDLRDEATKLWELFLPQQQLNTTTTLETEEELIAVEETTSLIDEPKDDIDHLSTTADRQESIEPNIVLPENSIENHCNYILDRAVEACNILKEFHKNGTHNDLKGANIAINRNNELELIDFGTYKKDQQDIKEQELNPIKHGTAMFISPKSLISINEALQEVTGKTLVKDFANIKEPETRTESSLKEYYIKRRLYDVLNNNTNSISSMEDIRNLINNLIQAGNTRTFKTVEELKKDPAKQRLLQQIESSNNLKSIHASHTKYMFQDKIGKFTKHRSIQWTIEEEVRVILQEIQKQVNARSTNLKMGCDASYDIYSLITTISGSANKNSYLSQVIYRYGKLNQEDLLSLIEDPEQYKTCSIQEYAGEGQGLQLDKMFSVLINAEQISRDKKQKFLQIKTRWENLRDDILLQRHGHELLTIEQIINEIKNIRQSIKNIFRPSEIPQTITENLTASSNQHIATPNSLPELQNFLLNAITEQDLDKLQFLLNNTISIDQQYLDILMLSISHAASTKNLEAFKLLWTKYRELHQTNYDFKQLVKDSLFDKIFHNISLSLFEMSFYDHPELLSLFLPQETPFNFKLLFNKRDLSTPSILEILLSGQNKNVWHIIKKILIDSQVDQSIKDKLKFITNFCYNGSLNNNVANIILNKINQNDESLEKILVDVSRLLANIIGPYKNKQTKSYRRLAKIILLASMPTSITTNILIARFKKLDNLELTKEEIATIDAIKTVANNPTVTAQDIIDKLLTIQNIEIFQEELIDVRLDLWYTPLEFDIPKITKDIAFNFFNDEKYISQLDALLQYGKNIIFKRLFDLLEDREIEQLKAKNKHKIIYIVKQAVKYKNNEIVTYILNKYQYDPEFLGELSTHIINTIPSSIKMPSIPIIARLTQEHQNLAAILQFTTKECIKEQFQYQQNTEIECSAHKMQLILERIEKNLSPYQNPLYSLIKKELDNYNKLKIKTEYYKFSKKLLQKIQENQEQTIFYGILSNNSLKQSITKFFPSDSIKSTEFNLRYYDLTALDSLIQKAQSIDISITTFSEELKQAFITKLHNAKRAIELAITAAKYLNTIIQEINDISNQPYPESFLEYNDFIQNQIKLCNDYPHALQKII